MNTQYHIIRIGRSGKFDKVFGLVAFTHSAFSEPLYKIVWLDSGEQVAMTGVFGYPPQAERFVETHRDELINREMENKLLL